MLGSPCGKFRRHCGHDGRAHSRRVGSVRCDVAAPSTVDGKAIKIASMIDEHARESLLNIVGRSITARVNGHEKVPICGQ